MKTEYIWIYDDNRRTYIDDNGVKHSAPIYRKFFVKAKVVDETKQSWILDHYGKKVPKNPDKRFPGQYAFSDEELDQLVYVHDHAMAISDLVRRANYQQLKQIAIIMGLE